MNERRPLWPVFAAYLLAFVTIVLFSALAAAALRAGDPDLSDEVLFGGLPALLAGGAASGLGLLLTVAIVARPPSPMALRLVPGRETGAALGVMVVGMLALGQTLDSLTALVGLGDRGSMAAIRRALSGAVGPELFAAVLVIGVLAGAAEEVFFRGYMQTRLRERWGARGAVVVTSVCFGVLHIEWLHALLAFALGCYLGFVVEQSGSALPAVVCHVANNTAFTLLTARLPPVTAVAPNVGLLVVGLLVAAGCIIWLRRTLRT
jgi:membrane protease YdiL (CAAX protease family)